LRQQSLLITNGSRNIHFSSFVLQPAISLFAQTKEITRHGVNDGKNYIELVLFMDGKKKHEDKKRRISLSTASHHRRVLYIIEADPVKRNQS
jgi:hypothetical protein